eukprot:TCONS_00000039-protein
MLIRAFIWQFVLWIVLIACQKGTNANSVRTPTSTTPYVCVDSSRSIVNYTQYYPNLIEQYFVPSIKSCLYLCCENHRCNGIYYGDNNKCYHEPCAGYCGDTSFSKRSEITKHKPGEEEDL